MAASQAMDALFFEIAQGDPDFFDYFSGRTVYNLLKRSTWLS